MEHELRKELIILPIGGRLLETAGKEGKRNPKRNGGSFGSVERSFSCEHPEGLWKDEEARRHPAYAYVEFMHAANE
jgi:hypothetical protein